MIKYLLFLFLFYLSAAEAQQAGFKEIKLRPNKKLFDTKDSTIIYPIVVLKNTAAARRINNTIKEAILMPDDEKISTRKALENIRDENTINLSYEVTFNKNGILSMYIYSEGCGAYCSSGNTYFNFDLSTGTEITISGIIDAAKLDDFKKMVLADKVNALTAYKKEEKDNLANAYIDTATYEWALQEVDSNCIKTASIENFSLSAGQVEIIDPCEFPHVIRSQEPAIELKYNYKTVAAFIKPGIRKRLLQ